MKVIGLTGGIGSGKTTVSDLFGELGIDVVDADVVSRQLTAVNGGAMPEIIKQFGPEAASPDSSMNRRFIRELVFSDPSAKTALENILHPLIRKECQRQLRRFKVTIYDLECPASHRKSVLAFIHQSIACR